MTHEELRDLLSQAWSAARRFERNAHLGQPIRSWDVYGSILNALAPFTYRARQEFGDDMWGLGKARDRLLALSKHNDLDRDAVAHLCHQIIEQVDQLTAEAKASRR